MWFVYKHYSLPFAHGGWGWGQTGVLNRWRPQVLESGVKKVQSQSFQSTFIHPCIKKHFGTLEHNWIGSNLVVKYVKQCFPFSDMFSKNTQKGYLSNPCCLVYMAKFIDERHLYDENSSKFNMFVTRCVEKAVVCQILSFGFNGNRYILQCKANKGLPAHHIFVHSDILIHSHKYETH